MACGIICKRFGRRLVLFLGDALERVVKYMSNPDPMPRLLREWVMVGSDMVIVPWRGSEFDQRIFGYQHLSRLDQGIDMPSATGWGSPCSVHRDSRHNASSRPALRWS